MMISLNENIKVEILELFNSLSSNKKESETFLHFLESRLTNALDNRIFLELRYLVFYENNTEYSKLVFIKFHTIYKKIAILNNDIVNSQFLDKLYLDFYEEVFLSKCVEMNKLLKGKDTIHKVLKHLSIYQEQTLNTNQLMIANISHDMRTALAAIEGYGNIINDSKILDDNTCDYLKKMQQSSKTLSSLVEDILSISKINSEQMEIEVSPFWIDEMMMQAISDVSQKANDKGLEISYVMPMLSSKFYGDRHRVYEIIVNLISNAIKYTPKGFVKVTLKVIEEDSEQATFNFEVKDSGLGISKEEQKTIFDPYKRYNNIERGVGLGLYISNQLAYKMNGKIEIDSIVGKGSIFSLRLKLKKLSSDSKPLKDLIVYFLNDYKGYSVKNIIDTLERLGAKVLYCNNSEEFSNKLFTQRRVSVNKVDMVVIVTNDDNYQEYDELIGYIKHFEHYNSTKFIAVGVRNKNLTNFNTTSWHQIPLSYYIDIASKKKRKEAIIISSEKYIKILAVDDIATNLELLKLFIKKEYPKIQLDLALDANEALEYYEKKEYNLIFLDLKMPHIDGFMLYEKLKKLKTLPTVYALTADAYKETYQRVKESGFNGMLIKPINIEKLYKIISEINE